MPTSRPRKKARIAEKAVGSAKVKSAEAISTNGSSGNPQFSTELIARVSTYVPLFKTDEELMNPGNTSYLHDDLHNLCLAAGPGTSRSIKQSFLKKNLRYIQKCQRLFGPMGTDWTQEGHLAWMSANKNWREYITDDVLEECKDNPLIHRTYEHHLSGFANPARAIQLGLVDALRFLVEDKLIDVNAKQWMGYGWQRKHVHLLTLAINANQREAFDYLLSLEAIDFNGDSTEFNADYDKYIFSSALDQYVNYENNCHFFRALVQHPKFNPNRRLVYGYSTKQGTICKMTLLHMFVNHYTSIPLEFDDSDDSESDDSDDTDVSVERKQKRFLHAFQLVLDTGADPTLQFNDLRSPFDDACRIRVAVASRGGIAFEQRLVPTLQAMIKMMCKQSQK